MARRYQLKFKDGAPVDADFIDFADALFAQLGLSPDVAQKAADSWQEYVGRRVAMATADADRAIEALKGSWGKDFDANLASGKKAIKALGLSGADLDAIERTSGFAPMMGLLARIGRGAPVSGGGNSNATVSSPEEAKAEIARLQKDNTFYKSLKDPMHAKHDENARTWEALHAQAYPAKDPAAATASVTTTAPAASAAGARPTQRDAAKAEIAALMKDGQFQDQLRSPGPQRQAAVDRWSDLHATAYAPGDTK